MRSVGADDQHGIGVARNGGDLAVAQRDAAASAVVGRLGDPHGFLRVRREADDHHGVIGMEGAQLHFEQPRIAAYQRHRIAKQPVQIVERVGGGIRGPESGHVHMAGALQNAHGFGQGLLLAQGAEQGIGLGGLARGGQGVGAQGQATRR